MSAIRLLCATAVFAAVSAAQVYSPKVLKRGQPDATNLELFAKAIYAQANAHTPRERAEAIWRFFLTDGRFVKPGFWYHIAGWAYEEPQGEVLDSLKLLNSYGFGLCYHLAPLLADVWKAGGFEDARVWFIGGHTVAEVFYDGAYHHFDSDMMGYSVVEGRVASVEEIERDPGILKPASDPWYPADVRANAIGDLRQLFATKSDNWLFAGARSPRGHRMDFVLRPGERLVRLFHPERDGGFYLPYRFDGAEWKEFPREIAQYGIRTEDGPRSQKDARHWGTGFIEYRPPLSGSGTEVVEVRSPYVIFGAVFDVRANLAGTAAELHLETSIDGGRTWDSAGTLRGPHRGPWSVEPAVLTHSEHGRRTSVSGRYQYLLRLTRRGGAAVEDLLVTTRVQLNPRTLPELAAGRNELVFSADEARIWREVPMPAPHAVTGARQVVDGGQGYWIPDREGGTGELVFRVEGGGQVLHAGARFLDLSKGYAPDKLTAEIRRVPALAGRDAAASIAWSERAAGPFRTLWEWTPPAPSPRALAWPEVDRSIGLPQGAREVYIRYRLRGLAMDSVRLGSVHGASGGSSPLEITHRWKENGSPKSRTIQVRADQRELRYSIDIPDGAAVENDSLEFRAAGEKGEQP